MPLVTEPVVLIAGWFLSSFCWLCISSAKDCDCLSNSSVRMLAAIVFRTIAILSVS